jgi:SAM-dependent methyltransferase
MDSNQASPESFDLFAKNYDEALEKGISVSGEDKNFFAKSRIEWLSKRLFQMGFQPERILDFGCGTGSAIPFLLGAFPKASVTGVEVSALSLELAKSTHASNRVCFFLLEQFHQVEKYDLVFCNGVFHHIPHSSRAEALKTIRLSLARNGIFAFWENNPWNPGTQVVMSRIPFDRDAKTISPIKAGQLLKNNGFRILSKDFCFYFPRALAFLRFLERFLTKIPLGAQYQIISEKIVTHH